jgi:DegV family protein with EDD domain
MTVKIVTDSGSDLPTEIAQNLGITIVPVYIYFGDQGYRDEVDISPDELYKRLIEGPIHPTTTQPMPVDFANVYQELSEATDSIVSIHLGSKVSGTYNSAVQGKEMAQTKCHIEVVDSSNLSMGLGLIAMAAARIAQAGGSLEQVMEETKKAMDRVQILGLLDTLKYLLAGGRITKARATVGSLLGVKPMLTLRDGELVQASLARTYPKGMDRLYEFAKNTANLQEVAIVQSTMPEEADTLKKRISSIIAEDKIHLARLGAGLGVHGGPGTIIVAARWT